MLCKPEHRRGPEPPESKPTALSRTAGEESSSQENLGQPPLDDPDLQTTARLTRLVSGRPPSRTQQQVLASAGEAGALEDIRGPRMGSSRRIRRRRRRSPCHSQSSCIAWSACSKRIVSRGPLTTPWQVTLDPFWICCTLILSGEVLSVDTCGGAPLRPDTVRLRPGRSSSNDSK